MQLYNDAYRPIPGDKHPRALGQPAAECWTEIWDVIGPMVEAPFRGEPATSSDDLSLMVRRKGFLEESHFKVAYSPVPDESVPSGIGGVLATVAETTEEVYARRQLATLRDLAGQAAEAKTAAHACERAAATLGRNARDVPCAFFYLVDKDAKEARLVAATGRESGGAADWEPPRAVRLDDDQEDWPVARCMRDRRVLVVDVGGRRLPSGAWEQPPEKVLVLPLAAPEQETAYGVFVAAASPHRELDEQYQSFFDLAAQHIASAIRNANAHEEALRTAEALANIDRAKTAFFSNVSHEFRTPLTLMLGPMEDALSSPEHALSGENLETSHRNALRLLKLVNALLDFSRIEAERVQAVYERTDLATFTGELASVFRSAIERAGLRFVVDTPPIDAPVYVDRDMWEKIVLNLLSNALKFTFDGEIAVALRRQDDHVVLTVRDTGTGVPAEEVPHLFERFHRVKGAKARTHEGSGIGLALVAELVKLHGGAIRVESVDGAGTTFEISIPTGKGHIAADRVVERPSPRGFGGATPYVEEALRWLPSHEPVTPSSLPPAAVESSLTAKRIVLADDNADMREYVKRLLSRHWRVEAVPDGLAALEAIRREAPALVVSDVMMPRLDGFGLLRALRKDPALTSTPIILLSARAGEEATTEGLHAGANDYLIKPFSARDLLARVSAQITIASIREQAERSRAAQWRVVEQLFNDAPAPICLLRGPELTIEYANRRCVESWQRSSPQEVIGRPFLEALPEVRGQGFEELLEEVMKTEKPHVGTEIPATFLRDGKPVTTYFNFVYAPFLNEEDKVDGVSVYAFDVTEQVLARRRLESANRELEQASRAKDEFLATLSHELRTPLNPIVLWSTVLLDDDNDIATRRQGLEVIGRNARMQARLVEDLMEVSRIVTGKLRLSIERVHLADVIGAAVDTVRPAADAKSVRLIVNVDPSVGAMLGDPGRLQQVVWNLLSNAVRFTPSGGRVRVIAERESSKIKIQVQDTGEGISQEHLPHVFERFRQVDGSTTRTHGGLGLGLAIVRYLTEAHGGTVSAASDGVGHGATFTIVLPIRAVDLDEAHGETGTQRGIGTTSRFPPSQQHLRGVRVLVVDDDPDSIDLLRVVLEKAGAAVHAATSARAALETRGPIDIIISDIGMPEMDGYMFIRRVRCRDEGAMVPAIALTAYARPEDAERALRSGYQEHLSKPVETARLLATVRAWTDHRSPDIERPVRT